MNAVDRFLAKVDRTGDCWLWTASTTTGGYGQFRYQGAMKRAHRVSWRLFVGPLTREQHLLHSCDNVLCVRPEHLTVGDQLANMRDKKAKGRAPRGTDIAGSTLTPEQVTEIRVRYAAGGVRQVDLAHEHGVCQYTISALILRKTWGWVA